MILTKNIIVYVGGFGFPDRTASAQRALENATLFASIGYKVVLMGKIDSLKSGNDEKTINHCTINGFDCYDIRHPDHDNYPSYESSIDSIESVVRRYGHDSVLAIIAYNHPPLSLRLLTNFAWENQIKMIAECTEWYGIEGKKVLRNLFRFIQTEYRMRYLHKRIGNIICTSRYIQDYYSNFHTVVLPWVVDISSPKWCGLEHFSANKPRRFIYAGSPGLGMSKDYVHLVVETFVNIKQSGYEFEFTIVGITEQQFLEIFPAYIDKINFLAKNINFLGRLSHEETIKKIGSSDFSVFLRPENRVSQVGFPTKLVEAFSCGVPTITNATSDIGLYLQTGKNGFLLRHPDRDELQSAIVDALTIGDDVLQGMKDDCKRNNPFRFENFREQVRSFLETAR